MRHSGWRTIESGNEEDDGSDKYEDCFEEENEVV